MRAEICFKPGLPDGRAESLSSLVAKATGLPRPRTAIADVIITDLDLDASSVRDLFSDTVAQDCLVDRPFASLESNAGWKTLIEISYKPGVTDTLAITARDALRHELADGNPARAEKASAAVVQTARQILLWTEHPLEGPALSAVLGLLHNPLIQRAEAISAEAWASGVRPPAQYPLVHAEGSSDCETFDVAAMDDQSLLALSRDRLLALSLDEMRALRAYYSDPAVRAERERRGLGAAATDIELEMAGQTWSEHCKHKLFNAVIDYRETGPDGLRKVERVESLFKTYIRATTEKLAASRPFLKSVFTDNSGVIAFDQETCLCIKAETHNSPSALDPYGGAITGIVGVNRDVLGTGMGAKPIFNTNVLCFGMPDTDPASLAPGILHPREVLRGVHKGIVDGGNQSGIPTAAGAFLFDESYSGKPLVFCGTGGIMPATLGGAPSWEKKVSPGDKAVMLGGRIGKDGIHGATFSSLELSESSPVTAVQIGDPIIQKKMTDFLLEARDLGLYAAITDNGAGGLSSSLGEMAEGSGGVTVDLDACPLKYAGLSPWEIWVSESQERMSLAVPPSKVEAFMDLARRRDVEATVVGEFTDSGFIDLRHGGKTIGLLSLAFLHGGLPRIHMDAEWTGPVERASAEARAAWKALDGSAEEAAAYLFADLKTALIAVLSDPNVASKEALVRQYDHEVQAMSIQKPFTGIAADAPTDGAVLKPRYDGWKGVTVTHGICPRYGDWDAAAMARCAVDEAMRAHVALGGDPDQAAALDNFCWPDPVPSASNTEAAYKAAQLVRACRGLAEACLAYGLPLVSGKDSMKNDSTLGGKRVSVRPTLLVTLMGIIPDARKAISSDFKETGDLIYLLGESNGELGGSAYERAWLKERGAAAGFRTDGRSVYGPGPHGEAPDIDLERSMSLYRAFHRLSGGRLLRSAHDLSEGGLAVALAESCLGGRLGARISIQGLPGKPRPGISPLAAATRALFGESPARFLVTVRPADRERLEASLTGLPFRRIGEVKAEPSVSVDGLFEASLAEIESAFKTPIL